VRSLAAFDPPGIVAAAIKKEFGLIVSAQGCEAYDPTKRAGAKLSERWKQMFERERKAFLEDTSSIPISHRATRLRALGRMAATAEEKGNYALAAQLHEQAAKECGDAFTNKRQLSGPGGGPIETVTTSMTAKEAAEAYASTLSSNG